MCKICAISDLHGYLPTDIQPCEVVLICGDISPLDKQASDRKMRKWLSKEFKPWAESLPCKKVFFIAGNHDYVCYRDQGFMYSTFPSDCKIEYLCDDYAEYESEDGNTYTIYGTPWCKRFGRWPFMGDQEELEKLYMAIPYNLDILLTHDQPYGFGDILLQDIYWNTGEHIGNPALRDAIWLKQPKYLFCGHLHSTDHNEVPINQTKRYNVSLKDEYYETTYKPLYLEI